jgi:hypothetical protein
MVRSHVPLCRSVRGTKEGLAVLAIAAIKTSIPVIRRSNDIKEGIGEYGAGLKERMTDTDPKETLRGQLTGSFYTDPRKVVPHCREVHPQLKYYSLKRRRLRGFDEHYSVL